VIVYAIVIAYLIADVWLYAISNLSMGEAVLLDIPLTVAAGLLAYVGVALTGGSDEDEKGYWPKDPRKL